MSVVDKDSRRESASSGLCIEIDCCKTEKKRGYYRTANRSKIKISSNIQVDSSVSTDKNNSCKKQLGIRCCKSGCMYKCFKICPGGDSCTGKCRCKCRESSNEGNCCKPKDSKSGNIPGSSENDGGANTCYSILQIEDYADALNSSKTNIIENYCKCVK